MFITFAGEIREAEILEVINNRIVYYKLAFDTLRIGFFTELFHYYMKKAEIVDEFIERIV